MYVPIMTSETSSQTSRDGQARFVPWHHLINVQVFILEIVIQVSVQKGIGNGVCATEKPQNTVRHVMVFTHQIFEEPRLKFRNEGKNVERQPRQDENCGYGQYDSLGPSPSAI